MLQELLIEDSGWVKDAIHLHSPNYEPRPDSADIELIVVHAISLPPGCYGGGYIEQFFSNQLDSSDHEYFQQIQDLKVSAHCLISRKGEITQFVSFNDRAWHAGASSWKQQQDCNDFSIGIELEGCDHEVFEEVQYRQLAKLIGGLRQKYPGISDQSICGHSDISPGRKTDPGPHFDWQKLGRYLKNLS